VDRERWERIQDLFHRAAALPAAEREAFLAREAAGDATLSGEVRGMLAEDERASMLDRDLSGVAQSVLEAPGAPAVPSHRFGPYRATRFLGEGGMGVVFQVVRDDLDSIAAVKILRDATLSPARRERFASEQRTLARLNHPAIARLYDAGSLADGTPWIVMEYVEGVPITEFCARRSTPLRERLRLFRAVCEAVQHAHQHAIIHRDLKPSNVLVRPDGTVKLLDFGIARTLDPAEGAPHLTRTAWGPMTPAYAAPEQVQGGVLGVHTDVYSLGVILYELLAGRTPFDLADRSPTEAAAIVTSQDPPPPSGAGGARIANRSAWSDLDVLCRTAMHRDPARRYATVEALLRDLDRFLEGRPLDARRDSFGYRASRFARRHWRPLAAAATVVLVVSGLVAFYTLRLARARNAALAEAARTERIQRFMLSLFQGGDEEAGPAESLRVVTMLDRGVQEARALHAEPLVQAELFATLGGLYQTLGELPRADSLLTRALERRRALLGPRHAEVARSLIALGMLRSDQAEYPPAERLVREGLAIHRAARPADPRAVGQGLAALGRVFEERGVYDSAAVLLEQAIALQSALGEDDPDLTASRYELANTHFYLGRYGASDSLNRLVLATTRRTSGERHPAVADVLINLGAAQHEQGRYLEAERYFRDAVDITSSWYGELHPKTAANLTMLGRTLIFQDRHDEAVTLLRRALAIRVRVYGEAHPAVASTVNELGNIALARDHYDEAEAAFRRMVGIYRAVYGERHYLIGIALSNLASVHMARKEFTTAEPLFRQAIARYAETLPAGHVNVGIARIKLGRTLLRQKRWAEAERETFAGYEILARQTDPMVSWLKAARTDLIEANEALHRPERAERFRREQELASRS
jgi:serine/threonine-protein kinase